MNDLTLVLLSAQLMGTFLLLRERRKRWLRRRWWVRPVNLRRKEYGDCDHLFQELKDDPDMFFKYTRMDIVLFNHLVSLVSPHLTKRSLREPLSPELRLAVTLRYLATGDNVTSLALAYRIGISTCYQLIKETCKVLGETLAPIYLKVPTDEQWKYIAASFWHKWNMPNCVGAIDGKHVSIQAPPRSGSEYFNYKKVFSIILMACCDADYKFILVDIGASGSNSDSSVFTAGINKGLTEGTLNLPSDTALLSGTNIKMPYYFVGDAAFQLTKNMMRPYPGKLLNEMKAVFNYRLSRARRTIENAFGILASRWRVFRHPIGFNPESVDQVILACICLHNFLMQNNSERMAQQQIYCPQNYVDHENGEIIQGEWRRDTAMLLNIARHGPHRATDSAYHQRDALANYFLSPEGEVSWQLEYIRRGYLNI